MTVHDLSGRRILVVEDESVIAMLIEDQLEELGCVIAGTAATVADAIALLQDVPVDGAVLDLNLHGEVSYAVAAALVAKAVPFLFTTGYGQAGLDAAYRHQPVLQKPFTNEALAQGLAALFAHGDGQAAGKTG